MGNVCGSQDGKAAESEGEGHGKGPWDTSQTGKASKLSRTELLSLADKVDLSPGIRIAKKLTAVS
eukprot:1149934-Pelagomonas_calceolata.AAC.3